MTTKTKNPYALDDDSLAAIAHRDARWRGGLRRTVPANRSARDRRLLLKLLKRAQNELHLLRGSGA